MVIISAMPRAGVRALGQLLGAGDEAGGWLRSGVESGGHPGEGVWRSSFFGHLSRADAWRCWEWAVSHEDAALIFLVRCDSDRYEVSLDLTHETWSPAYGTCSGGVLRRARAMRGWMEAFAAEHPGRCILLWQHELEDYETVRGRLGDLAPEREAWERVNRERPGKRFWPSRVEPEKQSVQDFNEDPFAGVDLDDDDPFLAPEQIVARHRAGTPRKFIEHPPEHDRAIVYPYLAAGAKWDELRYSLRSIERHFTDRECPIYIIGDRPPPWYRPGGRVRWLGVPAYARSRPAGLWEAQLIGWQIAEQVLWMNDDIYLLRDQGWEDFRVPLHEGRLDTKIDVHYHSDNSWQRAMAMAAAEMMQLRPGKPVYRYATHTPYLLERKKVLEVLRKFRLAYKGSFANLYFNWHRGPHEPCREHKTRTLPEKGHRFLNHGDRGPVDRTAVRLVERFPDAPPWERDDPPAVVWTSVGGELPHLEEFLRQNPDAEWYDDPAPRARGVDLVHRWRAADQRILAWWAANGERVRADRVAFVEADVRISTTLARAFPAGHDFCCAEVKRQGGSWPWFREVELLPEHLRKHAVGVNPLAVVVLTRRALDALLPLADVATDVYCELRLPTLSASVGYSPKELGSLANVHPNECHGLECGVSHPVKQAPTLARPRSPGGIPRALEDGRGIELAFPPGLHRRQPKDASG